MGEITDYLATLPSSQASALVHVVALALEEVPDAVEARSFGLPALKVDGRRLLGVAAVKDRLNLFPFSPEVIATISPQLDEDDGFTWSRSTIGFTADHPLPDDLVREVIRLRLSELSAEAVHVA